jgi:hypothetical protein
MTDKISKSIEPFQVLLCKTFKQTNKKAIEVLMTLACGHIFEIYTPNQLIQILGIDKSDQDTSQERGRFVFFLQRAFSFLYDCLMPMILEFNQ